MNLLFSVLCLLLVAAPGHPDTLTDQQLKTNAERNLFAAVNDYRTIHGKPPLAADPVLMKMARERVKRVDASHSAGGDDWNHHAYGMWPQEHADRLGFSGYATENLAMGYANPQEVVEGWMTSDGHRRQMLGEFKINGKWIDRKCDVIGVATSGKNYIAVFGIKYEK